MEQQADDLYWITGESGIRDCFARLTDEDVTNPLEDLQAIDDATDWLEGHYLQNGYRWPSEWAEVQHLRGDLLRSALVIANELDHAEGLRPLRRAIAALRLSFGGSFTPGETAALLRQVSTELLYAAACAHRPELVDLAERFDALAGRLDALAELLAKVDPEAARHPAPRSLAPPGRPPTAVPILANAPPAARVSVAA